MRIQIEYVLAASLSQVKIDQIVQNSLQQYVVIFQTSLGHGEHGHYFLILVFLSQPRHFESLQYLLQRAQSDFQFDQFYVELSRNEKYYCNPQLQRDYFQYLQKN